MSSQKPSRRERQRPGRKLLGLDLGERRVGVAVSDATGLVASPIGAVDLKRSGLQAVADLVTEHDVDGVVVGLPTTLTGGEGFQAERTRAMAEELEALIDVPLVFWDERLTSAIADQILERRKRKPRDKGERDAIAAAILLQSYLDSHLRARRDQN